jgi:hypothetical protein
MDLIDVSTVRAGGDADLAVAELAARSPYLRPQMVTADQQKRIWGQEILDVRERSWVFAAMGSPTLGALVVGGLM